MKIEDQVVSLELARKLKSLGVKQESYFYWKYADTPLQNGERWFIEIGKEADELDNEFDLFSAFSVSELGEMLPRQICDQDQPLSGTKGKCFSLIAEFLADDYSSDNKIDGYRLRYGGSKAKVESNTNMNSAGDYYIGTEVDARASMLIYLIEQKLITL